LAPFPWHLTLLADLIVRRLQDLTPEASKAVMSAAKLHPTSWRRSLRIEIEDTAGHSRFAAGYLLEHVGDKSDVRRLRTLAKAFKRSPGAVDLGRTLARTLAPRVFVEDLGRMSVVVGESAIPGSSIRRRVLALIAFLLTRPNLSCTRDQVLDALWPDLDPSLALNSLNQTVYFMRRVFQEDFDEDLSPRYVNHDSEVLWFDRGLVSSRSSNCAELIRNMPSDPSPDQVEALSLAYLGRFALDFAYEEWTQDFRNWLHASYLQIVERAVAMDLGTGHFDRGIRVARRALDVDADADSVEMSLLRLYRSSGAHAAAAEQYVHYAGRLRREFDVEAPPLESI